MLCVLMVEGMSVAVNVMLSLKSVINTRHGVQVGLGVGSWPSNRAIKSQVNQVILRDLTKKCRINL